MPNRRQAIIWTNDDLVHWRIYAALGGDELTPEGPGIQCKCCHEVVMESLWFWHGSGLDGVWVGTPSVTQVTEKDNPSFHWQNACISNVSMWSLWPGGAVWHRKPRSSLDLIEVMAWCLFSYKPGFYWLIVSWNLNYIVTIHFSLSNSLWA